MTAATTTDPTRDHLLATLTDRHPDADPIHVEDAVVTFADIAHLGPHTNLARILNESTHAITVDDESFAHLLATLCDVHGSPVDTPVPAAAFHDRQDAAEAGDVTPRMLAAEIVALVRKAIPADEVTAAGSFDGLQDVCDVYEFLDEAAAQYGLILSCRDTELRVFNLVMDLVDATLWPVDA